MQHHYFCLSSADLQKSAGLGGKSSNIDDFKPDESDEMRDFLTTAPTKSNTSTKANNRALDLDEDDSSYKPEILGYQDDFDSSGDEESTTPPVVKIASADIDLSSDEDDTKAPPIPTPSESESEAESSDRSVAEDKVHKTLVEPAPVVGRSAPVAVGKSVPQATEDETSDDDDDDADTRPSILTAVEDISDEG